MALVQGWPNHVLKYALLSTFSELSFESGFRQPFERQPWKPIFMRFGAILDLVQGWSNQGGKDALFQLRRIEF